MNYNISLKFIQSFRIIGLSKKPYYKEINVWIPLAQINWIIVDTNGEVRPLLTNF